MAEYIHESGGPLFHIGRYILMIKRCFTKPERTIMYWKETMRQMVNIGVGSVIIILLISFFIGAVTSTQFAYNLSTSMVPMYFVGYVVKESMILELAPTISGLILAGKVGSNLASELGTMRLTEQIDALEIMGVNTFSYLIGPKLAAAIIMVPILVVIAAATGIYGGLLAGELTGYVSSEDYMQGVLMGFLQKNINVMLIKATVFGFIITSISCYQGFYASGSALEIGKASTKAVVLSSVMVLVADFVLAWLLLN
ncbi:MAG: ABC transporter permease [Chitinophagales bacterium]|jgi:phospholipid/cholesterol/gamma-HCH transport system permease protein|nr:ABC transporter permease [Saprospirales bacterium]MBK8351728.1 ABC transporter permease [Saprospirales bacterium]MBP6659324.1 ABC transporter permease [Chitinophagales bacterium]HUM51887.1 ABC transporter permease [Chitinophagales bacterium]